MHVSMLIWGGATAKAVVMIVLTGVSWTRGLSE